MTSNAIRESSGGVPRVLRVDIGDGFLVLGLS